jgi:kynureninase
MTLERSAAAELDRADPLAPHRSAFVIDDDSLVYLDGNSLGRLTRASRDRVREVLEDDWGRHLIRSWEDRWIDLPTRIGDLIGTTLLGASAGDVVVGDGTTVALFKAISAALDARPDRTSIVIEEDNFPTDRYVVESLAQQHGLEIRWIPEAGPEGITLHDLEAVLDDQVAVAVLSQVDYRSAAIVDLAAMTNALHDVGALAIWDLCHSVGVIPIDLRRDEADLAVGCTYKYLNGGPGAPSFTYVRKELQPTLRQPIWGWWGRQSMFEMSPGYRPQAGIRSWLTGTPSILSLVAIEPSVELIADAGISAIRRKSELLTELAVEAYDAWLAPLDWQLMSPRDPARRGSHITVSHPSARELMPRLEAAGVLPDFRRPDGLRLGLAPLTTRFVDVIDGATRIRDLTT